MSKMYYRNPTTGEYEPVDAGGKSAYKYAQDAGYTGTEAEFAELVAYDAKAADSKLSEKIAGMVVQAEQIPIVDSIEEMTDTSKRYVLKSTGTIHQYKEAIYEKTITVTDEIIDTADNPYYDNSRLGSSGSPSTQNGYVITPLIDLSKYNGKTIELHLDGCRYVTETLENYIMYSLVKDDGTVYVGRAYTKLESGEQSIYNINEVASAVINNETSATLTITPPGTYGSGSIAFRYIRFCGLGAEANSNVYITYQETRMVTETAWVDTGVSFGGNGIDEATLAEIAKISVLNNESASPSTIKLLPKPVLDFYNASDYPSDDYSTTHLGFITYPCRADIPIPYTVKWPHNENAMRTTVAVDDSKVIGTSNRFTMRTYDATGFDNYPLYNLLPNKTYYYKVTHILADGSLVEVKSGSFTTSGESVRLIYIDGTQNVRDLGGWTALDGKTVKYGKIFRGASFSDSSYPELMLTGKGRRVLGELKVTAELNLGAVDTETSIAANCSYKKIGYANYATAITDATRRAQFKEALEHIVSCLASGNIYMHCQGGCDRTGTLSFQLLGLLGVSESDLAKEYELSSFSSIGYGRLRTTTYAVNTYDYVGMVAALKEYSGDTITDKFYDFATTGCGISADTIEAFRSAMLE